MWQDLNLSISPTPKHYYLIPICPETAEIHLFKMGLMFSAFTLTELWISGNAARRAHRYRLLAFQEGQVRVVQVQNTWEQRKRAIISTAMVAAGLALVTFLWVAVYVGTFYSPLFTALTPPQTKCKGAPSTKSASKSNISSPYQPVRYPKERLPM